MTNYLKSAKILPVIAWVLISQLAGLIGSVFTSSAIPNWYANLNKPSFNPPNWVFAPVWTTLYTLMGISAYLIAKQGLENKNIKTAITVFIIHLFLNALWSILFFGSKKLGLAFGEIIILWGTIVYLIYIFYPINKISSYLLIPYLLWVSFASILNFAVWRLN